MPEKYPALQPPQDWGKNGREFKQFLDDICTMLRPPNGVDVLLLQGWPEPRPDCDYYASALVSAAKQLTPKAPPIDETLHSLHSHNG